MGTSCWCQVGPVVTECFTVSVCQLECFNDNLLFNCYGFIVSFSIIPSVCCKIKYIYIFSVNMKQKMGGTVVQWLVYISLCLCTPVSVHHPKTCIWGEVIGHSKLPIGDEKQIQVHVFAIISIQYFCWTVFYSEKIHPIVRIIVTPGVSVSSWKQAFFQGYLWSAAQFLFLMSDMSVKEMFQWLIVDFWFDWIILNHHLKISSWILTECCFKYYNYIMYYRIELKKLY